MIRINQTKIKTLKKIGSPNPTNEMSENISDAENPGVLNDAEMLPTDSNTSQDNDIQMDNPHMNESSISEPNVEVSSNVEVKSFPTETKKNTLKNASLHSTDSQDNDTKMDNPPIIESSIIEPNVVETSNVETKSFATETQKIILKNAAVPSLG